ncbi:Alginate lyase [compost metagenome]
MPCAIGEAFDYSVVVDSAGYLKITLNGAVYTMLVNPLWDAYPFYFKAGAYVIDHDGPESEGGWVVYEAFDVQR